MKNAIILCSGGLDSITTAFYAKKVLKYDKLKILFFDYGQRNISGEKKCAEKCANNLGGEFIEIGLKDLGKISTSLLNSSRKHNKLSRNDLQDTRKENKIWYVPARNIVFLSNALAVAESLLFRFDEKFDIFVGFKCEGREHFPDATKEFIDIFCRLSENSTEGKFKILAPLIEKDKEDIVKLAKELGVNFEETFSCYVGKEKHCGTCLACVLRKEGFYWAGINDPTNYVKS
jgi:7-cyano-7-deazaguanine synthase